MSLHVPHNRRIAPSNLDPNETYCATRSLCREPPHPTHDFCCARPHLMQSELRRTELVGTAHPTAGRASPALRCGAHSPSDARPTPLAVAPDATHPSRCTTHLVGTAHPTGGRASPALPGTRNSELAGTARPTRNPKHETRNAAGRALPYFVLRPLSFVLARRPSTVLPQLRPLSFVLRPCRQSRLPDKSRRFCGRLPKRFFAARPLGTSWTPHGTPRIIHTSRFVHPT
jgi:hypothetical protein